MKSSTTLHPTKALSVLTQAALASAKFLKKSFDSQQYKKVKIHQKSDSSLVSEIDLKSEEIGVKILKKNFPSFGFLTEENTVTQSSSSFEGRFILDPLDGTTNFLRGFPMFCSSFGLEWQGELVGGVIVHPILGNVYTAWKGKGAFLNKRKISVSSTAKMEHAVASTGFYLKKKMEIEDDVLRAGVISHLARAIRRPGSAALDLAYTASGVFDVYWEKNLSPWDIAAGIVLVREAGGIVTEYDGKPISLDSKTLIASNRKIRPEWEKVFSASLV